MSDTEALLAKALELPPEERARLALKLSESLADAPQETEEVWVGEIARRIERLRAGSAETVSADAALAAAEAAVASRRA